MHRKTLRLVGALALGGILVLGVTALFVHRRARQSEELLEAVDRGDTIAVDQCLRSGADVNSRDEDGRTALHLAVLRNRTDLAKLLIEKGALVDARSDPGRGLQRVFGGSDVDYRKVSAVVGAGQWKGRTPLHEASGAGHAELVRLLIEHGADVNAEGEGNTPLRLACTWGHKEVAELLIANGADISAKDRFGTTALHGASEKGQEELVGLLLAKGADPNVKDLLDSTPLHRAASEGHVLVAELLLAHGAKLDIFTAAAMGKTEQIAEFLQHDPDALVAKHSPAGTPLHWAALNGSEAAVQFLLDKGVAVDLKDFEGATPLHSCACRGHAGAAEILLQKGAAADAKDDLGRTPLYCAVAGGHPEVSDILLLHGADPDQSDKDGSTLLYVAALAGDTALVRLLVADGAHVSAKNSRGETPLAVAQKMRRSLEELGDIGPPETRKAREDTMRTYAEIIELLKSHGAE